MSQPLQVSTYRQQQADYIDQLSGIPIPNPIEPENQQQLKIASTKALQKIAAKIADDNRQAFNCIKTNQAQIGQRLSECEKMLRTAIAQQAVFKSGAAQQLLENVKQMQALEYRLNGQ